MMLILVLVEKVVMACREFNVGRSTINAVEFYKLVHGVKIYNTVFRVQQFFLCMYLVTTNSYIHNDRKTFLGT